MTLVDRKAPVLSVLVAVLLLVVLDLACHLQAPPVQEWNESEWGPLVPHESFPGDCGLCHVSERWDALRDDFTFDHEQETGVPLEGSHRHAACLRCHNDRGPVSLYLARGCGGCHMDPHEETLGMDCERCHNQINWLPEGMLASHNFSRFPLYGAHIAVACDECHPGAAVGHFQGTPIRCQDCHLDDYLRTTNPDHAANNFPTSCQTCHNALTWTNASFSHTGFPISSGPHSNRNCSDCHAGNNFSTFTCLSCHEHRQSEMDDKHSGEPGYVYSSPACLSCHPDGRE